MTTQCVNITADEAAKCLEILKATKSPLVAADIAKLMKLSGSHETQRRHVRAIVKHLRDDCSAKIVATLAGGYWLTDDEQLWSAYLEGRQIDAKHILGDTSQKKRFCFYRNQGILFGN